jgi:hypothetical protein
VLGVAGDVGADDFPKKIVDATVQYAAHNFFVTRSFQPLALHRKFGKINHIINNGKLQSRTL